MAPLLYFAVFLLSFSAAFLANALSVKSSDSAQVQGLVQHPRQFYGFHSPDSSGQGSDIDSKLLDIVLIASVDGKMHALNRTSGQTLWTMSSFASSTALSSPSSLAPLVRTVHVDHDPDLTDDTTNQEIYIIEPQSGDIYVMSTPDSPLQRFPFSMSELVDMSPFSFADSEDRRVFVGRKETSLLLVELETGKIKATINSECPWDPLEDLQADSEVDLDELEGSVHRTLPPTEVYIGRTDYHIAIHTRPLAGNSETKPPVQNLSFSTYGPNNQDTILQASYKRTRDNLYIQSLPTGKIISFKAESPSDASSTVPLPLWANQFNNPIIAVFDVLQKPSLSPSKTPHTFVLLQPRLGLQRYLTSLSFDKALKTLPNFESAYVGMVEESGSLFAMSPSRYPLVAFGETDDRPHPVKLIDGPEPGELDDVDVLTRMRKLKEYEARRARERLERTCSDPETFDRRCLIGVRKLEGGDGEGAESRMKRLLDGPASDSGVATTLPSNDLPGGNATVVHGPDAGSDRRFILLWLLGSGASQEVISAVVVAMTVSLLWLLFGRRMPSRDLNPIATVSSEPMQVPFLAGPEETKMLNGASSGEPPASPTSVMSSTNPATIPNGDGEESDGNMDTEETPAKRKSTRRGKRGKKKKAQTNAAIAEEKENDSPIAAGTEFLPGAHASDAKELDAPGPSIVLMSEQTVVSSPSLIVSDTILGFGSHGTVVFQGSLQGRAVAVKRLLQDFVTLAAREVNILQESDDHPNVIRYYYQEAHANFLYIALELCPASLADLIESPDREELREIIGAFDPKRALRQIASGLRHLHALKLVHRDIKPQNILVSAPKAGVGGHGYRMLISDFGLCKKLDVDQTSFLPTAQGAMAAGTVGWRAPEILRGEVKLDDISDDQSISSSRGSSGTTTGSTNGKPTRLTKSVDIFALGCLFYYTLTNGGHPFGDRFEREVNILKNAKNLDGLKRFGEEGTEASDLIQRMLHPEASHRPDTSTCLLHPYFWDPGRRLNFFQDASDRFEIMCRDPRDPNLIVLETNAVAVVGNDWQLRLDKLFLETLGKFRKYDGKSVQDLLRALRNKKHHYQDLPDNVKRHVGSMPEGYLAYFTRRFPGLFLHVHSVIGNTSLRYESMFKSYFELSD